MSSIVDYINSWLYTPGLIEKNSDIPTAPLFTPPTPNDIIYLVSVNELLSVKLKSVSDIIPAPARNMPCITKFQLHMLNQAQLESILSVKLKHIKRSTEPKTYLPRHPVLRELLSTRTLV